jgi:hypothetical protein
MEYLIAGIATIVAVLLIHHVLKAVAAALGLTERKDEE